MIRTLTFSALAAIALAAVPALARDQTWPADKLGKETSILFIGTIGLYNF